MTLDPALPSDYLVGHVEDALARDPRVTEQGLRVEVTGIDHVVVVVTGVVVDPGHQVAIAEVIAELLPAAVVRDETTVADYPERDDPEVVS